LAGLFGAAKAAMCFVISNMAALDALKKLSFSFVSLGQAFAWHSPRHDL
jgi:hypothetical protein